MMSYEGPPIKTLTDEWVEHCTNNPTSIMLHLARVTGVLPAGVDPNDPRVIELLTKSKAKGDANNR